MSDTATVSQDLGFLSLGTPCQVKWGETYQSVYAAFVGAHFKPKDPAQDTPERKTFRVRVRCCRTNREVRTTLLQGEAHWRDDLRKPTPAAKRIGLQERIMEHLLRQRFAPGTQDAAKLLEVTDEEIVLLNNFHDCFWGLCSCDSCVEQVAEHPDRGNRAGKVLTRIRDELRMLAEASVEPPIPD